MGLFQLFVGFFILYAQSAMATGKKIRTLRAIFDDEIQIFVFLFLKFFFHCNFFSPLKPREPSFKKKKRGMSDSQSYPLNLFSE